MLTACASITPTLQPPCDHPAPLLGRPHRDAPGVIVAIDRDHDDPAGAAAALAARHNLGQISFLSEVRMFILADTRPSLLAVQRCESAVQLIEYNEPVVAP
jgi:hypothetical protein